MTLSVSQPPAEILPVLLDIQHALEAANGWMMPPIKLLKRWPKYVRGDRAAIRAERRLGQLLKNTPKNKGGSAEHDLYRTPKAWYNSSHALEDHAYKKMAEWQVFGQDR